MRVNLGPKALMEGAHLAHRTAAIQARSSLLPLWTNALTFFSGLRLGVHEEASSCDKLWGGGGEMVGVGAGQTRVQSHVGGCIGHNCMVDTGQAALAIVDAAEVPGTRILNKCADGVSYDASGRRWSGLGRVSALGQASSTHSCRTCTAPHRRARQSSQSRSASP